MRAAIFIKINFLGLLLATFMGGCAQSSVSLEEAVNEDEALAYVDEVDANDTFEEFAISEDELAQVDYKELETALVESKKTILVVEDERGIIYIIEFKSGEIKDKIKFGDKGDYEGIALRGKTAWVLKSNGKLYQVKDFRKGEDELNYQ